MTIESGTKAHCGAPQHGAPRLVFPFMAPVYCLGSCIAWPLVRFFAGINLVPHGYTKLFGGGMEQTIAHFAAGGLHPAPFLAYLVACTEFFGGLMIAFGLLTRFAAAAATIFLAVAIIHVHFANGFFAMGGGYEYPLLWGVVTFAIFLKGGGPFSIDARIGKEL
ncbi:MAG: DoxX family protein [Alphaproteobacteria bacterium]